MELTETKYKQTEVGLIPEDWKLDTINNIMKSIVRGPFGGALKKEFFVKDGYKVYEQRNAIYQDIHLGNYYINRKKFEELKRFSISEGDFIVSCSGTIGKIYRIPEKFQIGVINQALLKLSINEDKVSSLFFYYQFIDNNFQNRVIEDQGGAMKNLVGMPQFKSSLFILPELREQKAIATVLSDTDALIQALKKKIAKKKLIKKGVMQELLTPKEGWVKRTLGEFLNYEQPTNYIVNSTEYNDNYDIPVLTAGKSFVLGYTNEKYGVFKNGPVIIFDDFTTASKYVDFPFKVKSSAMKILKPRDGDVNLRFIYELMQQINFPLGDHKRHWIGEFQPLEVKVPDSEEEQNRIAQILSDMNREITNLEQKLSKYQLAKQGMMQQLLTGKIRLV